MLSKITVLLSMWKTFKNLWFNYKKIFGPLASIVNKDFVSLTIEIVEQLDSQILN